MVCSFDGILRTVSSLLKRFFFACVVTWELLGNICSEELEGYIISRVQTECAVCWGAKGTTIYERGPCFYSSLLLGGTLFIGRKHFTWQHQPSRVELYSKWLIATIGKAMPPKCRLSIVGHLDNYEVSKLANS